MFIPPFPMTFIQPILQIPIPPVALTIEMWVITGIQRCFSYKSSFFSLTRVKITTDEDAVEILIGV